MTTLLEELEQRFNSQVLIDIEINSLEDAYINIAKEELKLLNDLKQHGVRRFSANV